MGMKDLVIRVTQCAEYLCNYVFEYSFCTEIAQLIGLLGKRSVLSKPLTGRLCTSVVAMETTVLHFLDHKYSQIFENILKYLKIF